MSGENLTKCDCDFEVSSEIFMEHLATPSMKGTSWLYFDSESFN